MKNLKMTKIPQTFLVENGQHVQIERQMKNHNDPDLVCFFPHQRTENDEGLYQFEIAQTKKGERNLMEVPSQTQSKRNIELSIILTTQNEEIVSKIKDLNIFINQEELKTKIFKKKQEDNAKIIAELQQKKLKLHQQSQKVKTLNQSSIPNKSLQLNTTINTNAWLSQLFNKSELQSLWTIKQKEKEQKMIDAKIKSYTIDLSSFMNSARIKNQILHQKSKLNEGKCLEEKLRLKSTKVLTNRVSNSKTKNKIQQSQKQGNLNKNLSQMRTLKKNQYNPQR